MRRTRRSASTMKFLIRTGPTVRLEMQHMLTSMVHQVSRMEKEVPLPTQLLIRRRSMEARAARTS